ncbi:MAG: DUF2262 domain-containing protein [Planctomycetota bacterium]
MAHDRASFTLYFWLKSSMPKDYADAALEALRSAAAALPVESVSVDRHPDQIVVVVELQDESRTSEFSDALNQAFLEVLPNEEVATCHDPLLGELIYDDDLGLYEGEFEFHGKLISICASSESDELDERQVEALREAVAGLTETLPGLRERVAEEFLAIYEASWKHHDPRATAERLATADFMKRLSIDSVSIDDNLIVTFDFGGDDMFGEHGLSVDVHPDRSTEVRLS